MAKQSDAMMLIRAELCERLETARRASGGANFLPALYALKAAASGYGFLPVVHLAEAMERAIRRPDAAGACQRALYLDRLDDAIGCERLDAAATEAMIASVSVRFV